MVRQREHCKAEQARIEYCEIDKQYRDKGLVAQRARASRQDV